MSENKGQTITSEPAVMQANKNSSLKKWLPLIILVIAIGLSYVTGLHKYLSLTKVAENREFLTSFVAENWVAALALFMLIYAIATTLSLPGGALLTIIGGFMFGWFVAGTATVIAATAGATLVFLIARSSLGDFMTRKAGPFVKKLSDGFNEDATSYMFFLRLVPVFPFWLVNIAPALFKVNLRSYLLTTFFGIIPGTFAIALLGSGLGSVIDRQQAAYNTCVSQKGAENCVFSIDVGSLLTPQLWAAFIALGVVSLIPVVIKRFKARNNGAAG